MKNAGNKYDQYLSLVSAKGRIIDAMNDSDNPPKIVHFGDEYLTKLDEMTETTIATIPVGRNRIDVMNGDQWYTFSNRGMSWKNTRYEHTRQSSVYFERMRRGETYDHTTRRRASTQQ